MLTQEEEEINKLIIARLKAQTKLNKVNLDMGTAIRAEFSIIDKRIRAENKHLYEPLEDEIKAIEEQIKLKCE